MGRDLSRSRAILISNVAYRDLALSDIPAASGCISAMEAMLTSDLCGWPADRVESLREVVAPPELARKLVELVKDVQDVLLLYYVGHGMRTANGHLALALHDSSADPELVPYTAIVYEAIAGILRGCPAATKLVILDCCHAELGNKANYQFLSTDIDGEPVDGLYFIGASKRYEKAKSPLVGDLTYFTGKFIEVVHTGIPGKPPQLTIDQIFTELRARMLRARLPEPVQSGIRDAHQWPFARNAARPETYRDLDREIAYLLDWKAAAEARERLLQAEVAERTAEVEHLRRLARARSVDHDQQLHAALQEADTRLDDVTEAQAIAQAESRQAAGSVSRVLAASEPQVGAQQTPPTAAIDSANTTTMVIPIIPATSHSTSAYTEHIRQPWDEWSVGSIREPDVKRVQRPKRSERPIIPMNTIAAGLGLLTCWTVLAAWLSTEFEHWEWVLLAGGLGGVGILGMTMRSIMSPIMDGFITTITASLAFVFASEALYIVCAFLDTGSWAVRGYILGALIFLILAYGGTWARAWQNRIDILIYQNSLTRYRRRQKAYRRQLSSP
jgi:Caspase domain